jgi:hypothetical protein
MGLSDATKFGFYMVKIICEDTNIKKVFSFSENNVYTHNDIKFITDILIKKHNFNIKLELIDDVEYNAYVYEDESLTSGNKIFSNWFKTICELKKQLPKNILIKLLSSSLWGHLSKYNTVNKTMKQIKDSNMKVGLTDKSDFIILDKITKGDDETYYKLLNKLNPYKYNIRLKPFITSYGRIKTALVALLDIDNIIRIHTDGLLYSKKQKFNIKDLI